MSNRSLALVLGGLAIVGAGGLYVWRASPKRAPAPVKTYAAYTDPEACSQCHSEITKAYRQTGMGRSFYRADPTKRVEDFIVHNTLYHKASDRYYTMIEQDGKFYQGRHQIGFAGKETNQETKQIDFVIGSGNHARTYLHRSGEGKLVELPVSWYTEKGGYWAMSPGYDRPAHQDFRRAIESDCMFCHNAYPRNEDVPEGIDCQRCHGPGSAHVKDPVRNNIVNPATLSRDRQLDVCMQCHLETTSSRLPNSIRQYGREPYSYRPGEPLTDYQMYFDRKPGTQDEDRFEVAHQAYRLRKSECFLKSKMTCTTCHDPHRAQRGVQAVQHYVDVCRSCHAAAHSAPMPKAGSTCLDCHMWKRRTDDVVHVVMTDHYIQRRKTDKKDLLAPLPEVTRDYRGEVIPYYGGEAKLPLVVAQVQHEANLEAGIPQLLQAITEAKPANPEYYLALGTAYSKSGKRDEAIHWFEEALQHRADFEPALRELAAALALAGDLNRAAEFGEKLPQDPTALTNLGNVYQRMGKADDARRVLEKALTIEPDLPEAENLLGLVWLNKQLRTQAESSFRRAISVQPDFAEPHNNLGNLLAEGHDYAQAAFHFQEAIKYNPSYVDARHSYGLLLAVTKSFDQALHELQEAVRLDPNSAQLHIDLADVLVEKHLNADAEQEYRRALQLAPEASPAYDEARRALAKLGKVSP